jgi:hypothetical protein
MGAPGPFIWNEYKRNPCAENYLKGQIGHSGGIAAFCGMQRPFRAAMVLP